MSSTAARRAFSSATRDIVSSPPPATPPSAVSRSFPPVAACCSPEPRCRTTWTLRLARGCSVGAVRAGGVRKSRHFRLARLLPPALRATDRSGAEKRLFGVRARPGDDALGGGGNRGEFGSSSPASRDCSSSAAPPPPFCGPRCRRRPPATCSVRCRGCRSGSTSVWWRCRGSRWATAENILAMR